MSILRKISRMMSQEPVALVEVKPEVVLPPKDDPHSIGNILVELGAITEKQLKEAVAIQHVDVEGTMLGTLLTNLGFCSVRDISCALTVQEKRRNNEPAAAALAILEAKTEEMKANTKALAIVVGDLPRRKTTLTMAKVE